METYIYIPECNDSAMFESIDSASDKKLLYIEGPTLVYDKVNANKRIYKKSVLSKAINIHIGDGCLEAGGCVGELNHPEGGRSQTDPDRIAIKFTEVEDTGKYYKTKALVAEETASGKQVAGLYAAGIRMGISSRAYGSVTKKDKISYVNEMFLEALGDVVFNPSAPGAYMQAIREGKAPQEYILEAGNLILKDSSKVEQMLETHLDIINKASRYKINEAALLIFKDYMNKCL